MGVQLESVVSKVVLEFDKESAKDTAEGVRSVLSTLQKEWNRVSEITWGEFKEYSHATYEDVSNTWEKTTQDMKSIATESLWGTMTAWFEDDMEHRKAIRPREISEALSL